MSSHLRARIRAARRSAFDRCPDFALPDSLRLLCSRHKFLCPNNNRNRKRPGNKRKQPRNKALKFHPTARWTSYLLARGSIAWIPASYRSARRTECRIHVSGGEFNVAANLSDCFGLRTAIASAMVDYPIGDLIRRARAGHGGQTLLQTFQARRCEWPEHGHRLQRPGPRLCARQWSFTIAATRRPHSSSRAISTGRKSSLAALRWFTAGAIFAALSPTTAELIIEGMQAAKAAGAVVSFDLNYRAKLWNISGGHERAVAVLVSHRQERGRAGRERGGPATGPGASPARK